VVDARPTDCFAGCGRVFDGCPLGEGTAWHYSSEAEAAGSGNHNPDCAYPSGGPGPHTDLGLLESELGAKLLPS